MNVSTTSMCLGFLAITAGLAACDAIPSQNSNETLAQNTEVGAGSCDHFPFDLKVSKNSEDGRCYARTGKKTIECNDPVNAAATLSSELQDATTRKKLFSDVNLRADLQDSLDAEMTNIIRQLQPTWDGAFTVRLIYDDEFLGAGIITRVGAPHGVPKHQNFNASFVQRVACDKKNRVEPVKPTAKQQIDINNSWYSIFERIVDRLNSICNPTTGKDAV